MPATTNRAVTLRDHTVTFEEHEAGALIRDERVQRSIIDRRVRDLAAAMNLDGLGTFTVSKRDDGRLIVIDGQHRQLALLAVGMGEWPVHCEVHHGLSIPEEATLFRLKNNTRKPSALDDYLKGVVAGDRECLAIQALVERVGLRVAFDGTGKAIACVDAMRRIYRSKPGTGPSALGFALSTAVGAWGAESSSVDAHIVNGLGAIYLRYGEQIDRQKLIRNLGKYRGGPAGLIGMAKGLRETRPGTVGRCVAILVLDAYNRGSREDRQLPPL